MTTGLRQRYWRETLRWSFGLLALWALAICTVLWFAADVPGRVNGLPAGFWLAAQGLLGFFLLILVTYVLAMERLDRRWRAATPEDPSAPSGTGAGE